jgi:hypothetical protein
MAAAGLARRSSAYVSGPPECPGDTQEEFGGNRLNQVAAQVLVPIDRAVQGERDRPERRWQWTVGDSYMQNVARVV